MSNRTTRRARRSTVALGSAAMMISAPTAGAAPIDLGTSSAFVVLGGSAVTNTGPSVLSGDLGVAPGTSLTGFGLPAVVGGATHANDAVAVQAKADAATAFTVAAGQPISPGNVLTGTDLGGRTLLPGAYRYGSSAQLTGALTLDAGGDPAAQFVFEIGSTLTTASASSVVLQNGASACNVFWQVGSSATVGTGTAFQGNLLASTAVTFDSGASLVGRAFADTAAVSLDNNVLTAPLCPASGGGTPGLPAPTTPGLPGAPAAPSGPGDGAASTGGADGSGSTTGSGNGSSGRGDQPADGSSTGGRIPSTASFRRVTGRPCAAPFRARARGASIARVEFRLDGRLVATRTRAPFSVAVDGGEGRHRVTALISFNDGTSAKRLRLAYRACARAALRPRRGPSAFTG